MPKPAKTNIHRGKESRSLLNPADVFPVRAYNEETKTGIQPAEIRAAPVNRTESFRILAEPEKRARIGMQQPVILHLENLLFIVVNHNLHFVTRRNKPEPEFHGPGLFLDPDETPHGAATFPALLTPKRHWVIPLYRYLLADGINLMFIRELVS
jgi:hypothetical protein